MLSGPLAYFLATAIGVYEDVNTNRMLGIMLWMALWWMTEVVPLGVTALLPFILFPLLGIMNAKEVAPLYSHHIIFLFLGGFLMAFALEKWGLHERIAFKIIKKLGYSPHRIMLGFMLASFILSMWISNTATTLMLIAPALAVLGDIEKKSQQREGTKNFSVGLLLGIAYSASIGGAATYVGTPANIAFLNFYEGLFPGEAPSFVNWMLFAFPVALLVLVVTYLFLSKKYCGRVVIDTTKTNTITHDKKWGYEEKVVAFVFTTIALLWLTRSDIDFGEYTFRGWSGLFQDANGKTLVQDSTVAIVFAMLLFLIPTKDKNGTILTMKEFKKIPYNILLLFGGGFALSKGVQTTGLGEALAATFVGGNHLSAWLLLILLVLFVISLTELSSNTATIMLLLPILLAVSQELDIDPLYLMIPTTLASSFAFMFPVATPPNTIIFESERVPSREMFKTGVWINLMAFIVLIMMSITLGKLVFDF